jgi:hypothetical protein
MTFGYAQPFSFRVNPQQQPQLKVAGVREGTTEIILSDGRVVRVTLHVKDVKPNAAKPGAFDISYNVVTEVVKQPEPTVLAEHQTLQ